MNALPLIVLLPGVNHTPDCFAGLVMHLRAQDLTDFVGFDQRIIRLGEAKSLAQAMAMSLRHYALDIQERRLVLLGHSLGAACAAHLEAMLPPAQVSASVLLAPVGVDVRGAWGGAWNVLRHTGTSGLRTFGGGNLPVSHPGLRHLLYGTGMSAAQQAAAQGRLITPDPRTDGLGNTRLYPERRLHRHPTMIIRYRDDQLVTRAWGRHR